MGSSEPKAPRPGKSSLKRSKRSGCAGGGDGPSAAEPGAAGSPGGSGLVFLGSKPPRVRELFFRKGEFGGLAKKES